MSRLLPCAVLVFACAFLVSGPANAQSTTFIDGKVTSNGIPVPGADVELQGNNLDLHRTTDDRGAFAFNGLTVGHYQVSARKADLEGTQLVELSSNGVNLSIPLAPHEVGRVTVTSRSPAVLASGTDTTFTAATLTKLPNTSTIPNILLQLPTAARGTNGQIHINGDHNGITYMLDGVKLPESLNKVLGDEIDPSVVNYMNAIEGAYLPQYGDTYATILDIGTKAYSGPAGYNASLRGGSYNLADGIVDAHAPLGNGGSIVASARFTRSSLGLDPPVTGAPHNDGSSASQFLRVSMPLTATDYLNFDLVHSLQSFQIPPDIANGFPAATDDNEYQGDTFAALQFRHAIGPTAALSFGLSYKASRLLDTNDLQNDLAGGAGTTCTDFSDCNYFSAYADRYLYDAGFNLDYVGRSRSHTVRAGGQVDQVTVPKHYLITLQPGNQLSPTGAAYTVSDTNTNRGFTGYFYLQDSWKLAPAWQLDYGFRYNAFTIASTSFANEYNQLSPRIKLTKFFGERASAYLYYGRLFVPFSFENVDPVTASQLYVNGNAPGVTFDLKPQRDSLYEAGFHVPVGSGDLGFRISHKNSTDWIDDTQVGSTNLHQDINFPRGVVNVQSIAYQTPSTRRSKAYASVSHVVAQNSANCETQLLQNCALAGPPGGDWVQADHDQHYTVNGGIILNDRSGGWFSATLEYGSGLSTDPASCFPEDAVNCKVPPHTTLDLAKSFAVGKGAVVLSLDNAFNDRYAITLKNSLQGTHYAGGRALRAQYLLGRP